MIVQCGKWTFCTNLFLHKNSHLFIRRLFCLLEVFADISFVIVLFTDMNNDRTIFLFFLADDLVASVRTIHCLLITLNITAIGFNNGNFAQTTIFLLHKYQSLQNAGCFYSFHEYTSSRRNTLRQNRYGQNCTQAITVIKGIRCRQSLWQICYAMVQNEQDITALYPCILPQKQLNFKRKFSEIFRKMIPGFSCDMIPFP